MSAAKADRSATTPRSTWQPQARGHRLHMLISLQACCDRTSEKDVSRGSPQAQKLVSFFHAMLSLKFMVNYFKRDNRRDSFAGRWSSIFCDELQSGYCEPQYMRIHPFGKAARPWLIRWKLDFVCMQYMRDSLAIYSSHNQQPITIRQLIVN